MILLSTVSLFVLLVERQEMQQFPSSRAVQRLDHDSPFIPNQILSRSLAVLPLFNETQRHDQKLHQPLVSADSILQSPLEPPAARRFSNIAWR